MYVVRWYKTDTNHVPAQSVLQPIDSILKQFLNEKDPTLQETNFTKYILLYTAPFDTLENSFPTVV